MCLGEERLGEELALRTDLGEKWGWAQMGAGEEGAALLVVGGACESLREGPEPEEKVEARCVPPGCLQAEEGGGSVPRST